MVGRTKVNGLLRSQCYSKHSCTAFSFRSLLSIAVLVQAGTRRITNQAEAENRNAAAPVGPPRLLEQPDKDFSVPTFCCRLPLLLGQSSRLITLSYAAGDTAIDLLYKLANNQLVLAHEQNLRDQKTHGLLQNLKTITAAKRSLETSEDNQVSG